MTPANNQQSLNNGKPQQQPASGGPAPLQNKAQNDQMMASLKDIGSKLEADGKPSKDVSKDAPVSKEGSLTANNAAKGIQGALKQSARSSDNEAAETEDGGEESNRLSLDSFRDMNFSLNKAVDLTKGYLKKDRTAPFLGKLGSEVGEQVAEYVQEWAEKNNANISVSVTGVSKETAMYTGVGAAAGAGLGAALGGKVGGLIGLIFGAAFGTAASCVKVSFKSDVADEKNASDAQVVH